VSATKQQKTREGEGAQGSKADDNGATVK